MAYILAIDGGATKTKAAIFDEKKRLLGEGLSGPSNYQTVGIKKAIKNIEKAIKNACHNSKIYPPFDIACIALAGINSEIDYENLIIYLSKLNYYVRLRLVHDGQAALYAANEKGKGIIVILGTGSLVASFDEKGNYVRACNWGHYFGDEGSAFRIACRVINEMLKGYDGRKKRLKIENEILKFFKIKEPSEIASIAYTKLSNEDIAKLAPFVIERANEEESVMKILEEEANSIAEGVLSIHKKTGNQEVYLTGGLTKQKESIYLKLVIDKIKEKNPKFNVSISEKDPLLGCLRIALKELSS